MEQPKKIWANFPGYEREELPELDEIELLFIEYAPEKWTENASIRFEFEGNRIIIQAVIQNPNYGFWLWHREVSTVEVSSHFSLGQRDGLDEYVEMANNSLTLKGIYVSPNQAWSAVRDFVERSGQMSEDIDWIAESDLPDGKNWLVGAADS